MTLGQMKFKLNKAQNVETHLEHALLCRELLEDAVVGLVHPIELSEESLEAWKEQL